MGADRFYCPQFQLGQVAHLDGDEARHLSRVRRVGVGAEVEIFDGRGTSALAEVVRVGRDRVELLPRQVVAGARPGGTRLTLATAIPKGDRFDWLIEKATELGVERVVPLITERSTVDPRSAKLDRLRRAIIEACKQCRRDTLMELEDPVTWERWIARTDTTIACRWVAHPGGTTIWRTKSAPDTRVIAAIGPEGGLTEAEIHLARSAGWGLIDLTTTILRIETAALAVAASCLLQPDRED